MSAAGLGTQGLVPNWAAPTGVHAFTTLRGPLGASLSPFDHLNLGARCGDAADAVQRNRELLQAEAGLPAPPCWLNQVHGTAVHRCAKTPMHEPEADAAVTAVTDVVLAILSADCLPVLFCAADGSEVAAAHAGWRGLCAGVLEATVAAMHTPAEQMLAWLGPAAGATAYEVGEEVRDAFLARHTESESAFHATRPGHWLCDLYQLARQRLRGAGLNQISGGEHCTISEPQQFFSHRRDRRSGRMATLVWVASERASATSLASELLR